MYSIFHNGSPYMVRYAGEAKIFAQTYNKPGTYTLNIPANIDKVYVTGCGGGAGGVTLGAYNASPAITLTAGNGGDTKVGTFVIPGGKGGKATLAAGNVMTVTQPDASVPNGVKGETKQCRNVDFTLHGSGFLLGYSPGVVTADIMNNIGYYARSSSTVNDTYYAQTGIGSVEGYGRYGAGGGSYHFFDSDGTSNQVGIAGNSGAFVVRQEVAVTPNSSITIVVGAGGAHAFYSNDNDGAGRFRVTNDTSGFVIVEYAASNIGLADWYKATNATITVQMPNGTACANKAITLNGKAYTTNASGQVILTGNLNDKETVTVKYGTNYWVDVTVTYSGSTYTAKLVEHVIAGRQQVSVWNFSENSDKGRAQSFTVPSAVKVIKITGSGFDGYSDEASDAAYIGTASTNGYGTGESNTVWYAGTGSFTRYIGVTAGKTYTIYGRWISGAVIEWSDAINNTAPNHTSY